MEANIDDLVSSFDKIDLQTAENDEVARHRLLEASRRLIHRLETPFQRVWQLQASAPVLAVGQVLMEVGLWEAWREAGGKESSLEELCALCKVPCDLGLLRRLLRAMAASSIAVDSGEDRYGSTPLSIELGNTAGYVAQTLLASAHHIAPAALSLPGFLKRTSYREPLDPTESAYMDADPQGLALFARFKADPEYAASFTGTMEGFVRGNLNWTELYDTRILMDGFDVDGDAPLCVDIGGGHGMDLERLLKKHPEIAAGRLVLQDLPTVVSIAKVDDRIKPMEYDMFTPQPMKGSRAYFMHSVLHDHNDADAQKILKIVAAAMVKGYSKLLICEMMMPPTGSTFYQAMVDIMLLQLASAAERTEHKWSALFEGTNLRIVKIWRNSRGAESIIEAELI